MIRPHRQVVGLIRTTLVGLKVTIILGGPATGWTLSAILLDRSEAARSQVQVFATDHELRFFYQLTSRCSVRGGRIRRMKDYGMLPIPCSLRRLTIDVSRRSARQTIEMCLNFGKCHHVSIFVMHVE